MGLWNESALLVRDVEFCRGHTGTNTPADHRELAACFLTRFNPIGLFQSDAASGAAFTWRQKHEHLATQQGGGRVQAAADLTLFYLCSGAVRLEGATSTYLYY